MVEENADVETLRTHRFDLDGTLQQQDAHQRQVF